MANSVPYKGQKCLETRADSPTPCLNPMSPRDTAGPVRVEVSRVPDHIAIIMDGNGRWAEQLGRPREEGHRAGSDAVRRTVRACRRLGVKALTLYAFSEQNWERPETEVEALMGLLREFLVSERREILDHSIQLRAIGSVARLPAHVRDVLDPLATESSSHRGMTLTLALSYGGQEEILEAARAVSHAVAEGRLRAEEITMEIFNRALPSMDVGPVDLLIRTSGEKRISNFLLWGCAYAELFFTEVHWPDFDEPHLYEALSAYQSRQRRFGLVGAQLIERDVSDARAHPGAPALTSPPHV